MNRGDLSILGVEEANGKKTDFFVHLKNFYVFCVNFLGSINIHKLNISGFSILVFFVFFYVVVLRVLRLQHAR